MAVEFVALAVASKEAKWLRNLLLEVPLRPKPMSPLSITIGKLEYSNLGENMKNLILKIGWLYCYYGFMDNGLSNCVLMLPSNPENFISVFK